MEVKRGYKQTEVGVIPEEWEVQPLSRTIERLEAGVSVNSVDENLTAYAHNQSVLKTSAVSEGRFLPHECKKIAPQDLDRVRLRPRADTIIVSRMNTPDLVGECGYVERDHENLFLPDRLWMTKQRGGTEASIRWLSYLLSSKPQKTRIKELATGTSGSMKNLAKGSLLELQIPTPPPPEQRAIATALSDVDGLLGGLDRLIAKKRDIKQAAMQQLLTGQTRLPGWDGAWVVKRLGDVVESLIGGGTPSRSDPAYWGNEIPWVTVKDFATFNPRQTQESITKVGLKNSASHLIPAGTLITSTRMALGKAVIYEVDVAINQDLKAVFLGPGSSVQFLYYWFEHNAQMIDELGSGSTVKGISIAELKSLPFPLVALPEQTAIGSVLTEMDGELAVLEQRREKTRALKQAMMQELLTGRTRLL